MRKPDTIGIRKSFGFGDRLGLATPGHLAAAQKFSFAPVFAQQSIREIQRMDRTPRQVMESAGNALAEAGYDDIWGADADHLKSLEDAERCVNAGFKMFTVDPSDLIRDDAGSLSGPEIEREIEALNSEGLFGDSEWEIGYVTGRYQFEDFELKFTRESVVRAAVKFGRAIEFCEQMANHIANLTATDEHEIEFSVDETQEATTPLEHLFIGLELKRRGVALVSVAPRFPGQMEKGVDYNGDMESFTQTLRQHVAIARRAGPYKISVHSGSDKLSIYPVLGRECGDLLHVKTSGASYLEALRVIARKEPELFREIAEFAAEKFSAEKESYHISTTSEEVEGLDFQSSNLEEDFLGSRAGRQLLHVTFGPVLERFGDRIREALDRESALYHELLEKYFSHHLDHLTHG